MKRNLLFMLTFLLSFFVAASYSSSTYASNVEWVKKADLPIYLSGSASVVYNDKIYIFGGGSSNTGAMNSTKTNKVFMYDPISDSWAEKKSMPTTRAAATAVVYNEKIFVIGGYFDKNNVLTRTNVVEAYDPSTDSWETKKPLQTARSWAGSAIVDGKIHVFGGGYDNTKPSLNTVEAYDPVLDQWSFKNNMPFSTNGPSVAQVEGKIYITGGTESPYGETQYVTSLYEYDSKTDTYSQKSNSATERTAASAVVFNNNIYYLGSGQPKGSNSPVEKYNPNTDSWSSITDLTFWRFQSSAAIIGNNIYIIGGASSSEIIKTVEMFTIEEESFPNPDPEPEQPSGDRAILTIIMTTGLEKEFDLSMQEVNDFIKWFDAKENEYGPARYGINKHNNNKGPFSKRVDYVIFKNILSFEVNEYTTE